MNASLLSETSLFTKHMSLLQAFICLKEYKEHLFASLQLPICFSGHVHTSIFYSKQDQDLLAFCYPWACIEPVVCVA